MEFSDRAVSELIVMISGGFALAYQEVVPEFERSAGVALKTLSGASQGTGPTTIKSQLERGIRVDVVILSNEGLHELTEAGWILQGSATELASAPLAAAVRAGTLKPDISTVAAFKRSLLKARLVVMPGSTSGLFIKNQVLPKLGIAGEVRSKLVPRGTDSAAALAAGEADIALGPVSELVNVDGIELVGPLPEEVQLVQTFTAAIVKACRKVDDAERLTAFLASDRTTAAIRKTGMEPAGDHRAR
ncbi:MAG TPA: substrate-binding domain-containing protein [Bradyrhizobium sp.]|nr:substrate-binding domain-containing protein [Bradyrhizobium sp.]